MSTVSALLGELPSAPDAADMDSIANIWVLIAKTIRETANGIEHQLLNKIATRTDVIATKSRVASRQVFPAYDGTAVSLRNEQRR